MESQIVRKRVNIIAGHLAPAPEDLSATHIFPMSCSNNLNSVIRRCDSRVLFARQGSSAQAFFMRQALNQSSTQAYFMRQTSNELSCSNNLNSVAQRCDSRTFFARQGSSSQACFMRPEGSNELGSHCQPAMPLNLPDCANKKSTSVEEPMFSRPTGVEPSLHKVGELHSSVQRYNEAAPDAPKYSRPERVSQGSWSCTKEITHAFGSNGSKWSPRMDVAESGQSYVVTVELPGVCIDEIKVEVSDQNLTVTGSRSAHWSRGTSCSNDSISAFHKQEILQGPYQVVWSLPINVNKDRVSADFANGLLRITLPKLSEISSRVIKANI